MEARKTLPTADIAETLTLIVQKIEGMDARTKRGQEALTAKFDGLEAKVDGLEAKVDGLAAKGDDLAAKVEDMDARMVTKDDLDTANAAMLTQLEQWFASVNARIDQLMPGSK